MKDFKFYLLLSVSFLFFQSMFSQDVKLQGPGGLTDGLRYWLTADTLITTIKARNVRVVNDAIADTTEVISWKDRSGYSNMEFYHPNGAKEDRFLDNTSYYWQRPVYRKNSKFLNYHSGLYFMASSAVRSGLVFINGRNGINSSFSENVPTNGFTWGALTNILGITNNDYSYLTVFGKAAGNNCYPGFGYTISSKSIVGRAYFTSGGSSRNGSKRLIRYGETGYSMYSQGGASTNKFKFESNGVSEELSRGSGTRFKTFVNHWIGIGGVSRNTEGHIGEFVAFEKNLSDAEKYILKNYWGLKYALTLFSDNGANFQYVLSNGEVIWDGLDSKHTNYHHNVAAVITDSKQKLFNPQAKSSYTDSFLIIGVNGETLGEEAASNNEVKGLEEDLSAIAFGDNGNYTSVSLSNNPKYCGDLETKVGTTWLIDKNLNRDVDILLSAESTTEWPYNNENYSASLLVANKDGDLEKLIWTEIPGEFRDGRQYFRLKLTQDLTYISFAVKKIESNYCLPCDNPDGESKVSFNFNNWGYNDKIVNEGINSINTSIGDVGINYTTSNTETNDISKIWYSKYYPYPRYNGLYHRRYYYLKYENSTNITIPEGQSSLISFDIDYISIKSRGTRGRYDDFIISASCDGKTIQPIITPIRNPNNGLLITGSEVTLNSGNKGYYSKVNVSFIDPINKLSIIHNVKNNTANISMPYLINNIILSCPIPPPIIPESKIAFTLKAPKRVDKCTDFDYTFKIYNKNCNFKMVDLENNLPEGLLWKGGSVTYDSLSTVEYANARTLKLKGITVPPRSEVSIKGTVYVKPNADVTNAFENRGELFYSIKGDDGIEVNVSSSSCDAYTANVDCLPTYTKVEEAPDYYPIAIDSIKSNDLCYKEGRSNLIDVYLNNRNEDLTVKDFYVDFDLLSAFKIDTHVFFIDEKNVPVTIQDISPEQNTEQKTYRVSGLYIKPGKSKLSFRIRFDTDLSSLYNYDIPVNFDFINKQEEDYCGQYLIDDLSSQIVLKYCGNMDDREPKIQINPHTTSRMRSK